VAPLEVGAGMSDPRKEAFERVFDDIDRKHSAFPTFVDLVPLRSDDDLRFAWSCFRAGWNEHARRS